MFQSVCLKNIYFKAFVSVMKINLTSKVYVEDVDSVVNNSNG